MGAEKTDDIKPARDASNPPAAKPLAVQMMDFVADSAAAFATAIVTAGAVKADEAVNRTREVIASIDESAKAATENLQRKTAARKPTARKAAAKKSSAAKKSASKKAAPKKTVRNKASAKKPSKKPAVKSRR